MKKKLLWLGIIALAAQALIVKSQASAEAVWLPNVRVDNSTGASIQNSPKIAVDVSGNMYVVWSDFRSGTSYADVYFTKSTDGGATFGPNVKVNDVSTLVDNSVEPSVAVDTNGNIYVAWHDRRYGGTDIYFAKSTNGGASFSANVKVNDAVVTTHYSPSIALAPNGNIYIVWHDWRSDAWGIYFAKSSDGGISFGSNVRVDNAPLRDNSYPSIAVAANGDINIVWGCVSSDCGIFFAKSIDAGISFSPAVEVTDVNSYCAMRPSLALGPNGNIYVVWAESRNSITSDIYFSKSIDGGASFCVNVRVDDSGSDISGQYDPSLGVDAQGNICVLWEDTRNSGIYFTKSSDGGVSFDINMSVDDAAAVSGADPSLAADASNNIHAVWSDMRNGNYDIYSAKSINGWVLNLSNVPYYQSATPYNSTAAASSQMVLNYLRQGAGFSDVTQNQVYEYANSPNPLVDALEPDEVDKALDYFDPGIYNFGVRVFDPGTDPLALNKYMRDICHWMAYSVPGVARPNVPVVLPILGLHTRWAMVKGCATDQDPCPADPWTIPEFTVCGFWLKDPMESGLGQEIYVTAAESVALYFAPLQTGDSYLGKYVLVAEPPEHLSQAKVKIEGFKGDVANLEFMGVKSAPKKGLKSAKPVAPKKGWQDILPQALLADPDCKAAFSNAVKEKAILVKRADAKSSYYLLPFNKKDGRGSLLTSGVVILDTNSGAFKEATWAKAPQKFLKVNENNAIKLIVDYIHKDLSDKTGRLPKAPRSAYLKQKQILHKNYDKLISYVRRAKAELLWQPNSTYSSSPYQPYWKIDANGYIWFVTQGGKVSSEPTLLGIMGEIEANRRILE